MINPTSKLPHLIACSAFAVLLAAATNDAQAAGGARARAAGANSSVVRTTQRTRTDNGYTVHSSATNAAGQTATRDAVVTHDQSTGTTSRNGSWTNARGQSGTFSGTRTRTDSGSVSQGTVTRPDGSTVQHSATRVCDKEAKSCTTTATNSRE